MSRLTFLTSCLLLIATTGLEGCSGSYGHPLDEFEGHRVTDSDYRGDGCYYLTYELDPEWSCSEEQIARAESVYGGVSGTDTRSGSSAGDVYGVPAAEAIDFEDAVQESRNLQTSTCTGLADLQRDALRKVSFHHVSAAATAALRPCLPTVESTYVQNGVRVDYCTGDSSRWGDASSSGPYASGTGGATSAPSGNFTDIGSEVPADGASEYSTTNNQVAGVEEADYVKNDAGHVFVLTARELRVFDTWPVEEARQIARVPLSAEPRRLLLAGSRLVVFQRESSQSYDGYGAYASGGQNPSSQGCTYGYSCRFQSEGGSTKIEIFDISEPARPTLIGSYALSGAYVASRRIGNTVHLVVHNGGGIGPQPVVSANGAFNGAGADQILAIEADLYGAVETNIEQIPDHELLPQSEDDEAREGSCDDALVAPGAGGADLVSLVSFDLDTLGPLERTLIAAAPGYVYVSTSALYMATDGVVPNGSWGYYRATPNTDISAIHKFSLEAGRPAYRGSALVRGHVLNQFAMDEYEGVLRVASTSGWVPDNGVISTLTTLREDNGQLRRFGELTGLAPTEDIRSVRFDGDRGFVVTFKKTDPLFAFDLSTPEQPKVLGELKIPGFSSYMHPIDRDHILAVGFDADDQGDFAYFDGIQIQMFDVSDMTNPSLLHKTVIGTRGSGSEALLNHLAFNYFPARQMLAMPVSLCSGGDNGVYGSTMEFSGLMVFDVSIETGIQERGRMPFADPAAAQTYDYGSVGCHQWWSSSTSNVKRSIFFDDYVFGLSDAELRAAHVDSMDQVLVTLPLADGS